MKIHPYRGHSIRVYPAAGEFFAEISCRGAVRRVIGPRVMEKHARIDARTVIDQLCESDAEEAWRIMCEDGTLSPGPEGR